MKDFVKEQKDIAKTRAEVIEGVCWGIFLSLFLLLIVVMVIALVYLMTK